MGMAAAIPHKIESCRNRNITLFGREESRASSRPGGNVRSKSMDLTTRSSRRLGRCVRRKQLSGPVMNRIRASQPPWENGGTQVSNRSFHPFAWTRRTADRQASSNIAVSIPNRVRRYFGLVHSRMGRTMWESFWRLSTL